MMKNFIIIIFTALIAGGGVYLWQDSQYQLQIDDLKKQISELEGQASSDKSMEKGDVMIEKDKNGEAMKMDESKNTGAEDLSLEGFAQYERKDHNFSLSYPEEWSVKEGEQNGQFHVFFSDDQGNSFGVLPGGELDFGAPQSEPIIETRTLAEREVNINRWELDSGEDLIFVKFFEYPETWNSYNRFHFKGTDDQTFEKMISSFQFTE